MFHSRVTATQREAWFDNAYICAMMVGIHKGDQCSEPYRRLWDIKGRLITQADVDCGHISYGMCVIN